MPVRPSLIRNIPFWILLAASAVLTAVGSWLVLDRLTTLDTMLRTTPTDQAGQIDQTVAVYAGPPTVTAGAVLLGAGLLGLLIVVAIAAVRSLLPAAAPLEVATPAETDAPAEIDETPAADAGEPVVVATAGEAPTESETVTTR